MQQTSSTPYALQALEQQVATLRQFDQLASVPGNELRILAEQAVLRASESRTTIMVERSAAHHLFLLLDGEAEQSMRVASGETIMLARPGPGAFFGEGGLFGQRQRRTTVHSQTRVRLLQWKYEVLETHRQRLPQTFRLLQETYREHLLYTTLAQVPQLATLDAASRAAIALQVNEHHYDRGAEIVRAGSMRKGVYIIADGQVRVVYADRTVAVLNPGAVFGEMSFVDNTSHEASIVALTPVHVLEILRPAFEQLLNEHPQLMEQLRVLVEARRTADRIPEHVAITEQLVDIGVARGNMVLAKHTAQCIPGCQRCEEGCAERFDVSRLRFGGTIVNAYEVPDTCRHCQWGAECAEVCPVDAFSVTAAGYLIITDRCTGCGACLEACPYDAINQVPTFPAPEGLLEHLRFALYPPSANGFKANKCDTCHGHDDYACISACPTGALQWIPVEALYQDYGSEAPVGRPTSLHKE